MWVYGESLHGLIGGIRMFVPAMLSFDGNANLLVCSLCCCIQNLCTMFMREQPGIDLIAS
jgi:hypothetical protein